MRSAECGMRNFNEGSFASRRLPLHSAFRTPHSALSRFLYPPFSRHEVLEQHHPPATLEYDFDIAAYDRLSPPFIVDAPYLPDHLHPPLHIARFTFHERYHGGEPLRIQLHNYPLRPVEHPKAVLLIPHSALRI